MCSELVRAPKARFVYEFWSIPNYYILFFSVCQGVLQIFYVWGGVRHALCGAGVFVMLHKTLVRANRIRPYRQRAGVFFAPFFCGKERGAKKPPMGCFSEGATSSGLCPLGTPRRLTEFARRTLRFGGSPPMKIAKPFVLNPCSFARI